MIDQRPIAADLLATANAGATAIGYLDASLLSERRLELARRGLYAWTGELGIELMAVWIELEHDYGTRRMLHELGDEIQSGHVRYVVVPDLNHFGSHRLLQGQRVDIIERNQAVTVLSIEEFIPGARHAH